MKHYRIICPVGQGGFSIESIDNNYVVAYDCGSISSPEMVELSIYHLKDWINCIDVLFISHFDKDHVNGIRDLLSKIKVRQAVTSFIPGELKIAYNVYTDGAYSAVMTLLRQNEVGIREIGEWEDEPGRFTPPRAIWEWIAKSMMTNMDFRIIQSYLKAMDIYVDRLREPSYADEKKEIINNAFKSVFGSKGPNSKGLIMLSQPCEGTNTKRTDVICRRWPCLDVKRLKHEAESSCLYVGDADLRNIANRKDVIAFLQRERTEDMLLFMQIPHHGSQNNIGKNFERDFPALYYFVNDKSINRIRKKSGLFASLTSQKKLLVSTSVCRDTIESITEII